MLKKLFSKTSAKARKISPVSPAASQMVESLEDRRMMSTQPYALGINVTTLNESSYSTQVKALRDTGTKSVRLWWSVTDYNSRSLPWNNQFAKRFSDDGFDVMAAVVPKNGINPSSYGQAYNYFKWLSSNSTVSNYVDRWQVGNEPDHETYWKGSVQTYVTKLLAPAADALHDNGKTVVSAGPSWNPADIKSMVDVGLLKYADMVGYHPYRSSVSDLKSRIAEVKGYVGGKPLVASEWSATGHQSDKSDWADINEDFFPVIADNFYAAYYFASVYHVSGVGAGAILKTNLSHNEPFFSSYNTFKNYKGGDNIVGTTPTPTPTPSPRPSPTPTPTPTPSPTPTPTPTPTSGPSVTSVTLFNSDTNKAVATITSGQTFDFADLGTHNLTFLATGNGATQSVKFNYDGGTQVESLAPWAMFGDDMRGNLYGNDFDNGTYNFNVQAFGGNGATGTAGAAQSFTINFTDSGNIANNVNVTPQVRAFAFLDANTGLAISGYNNITSDMTVSLSALKNRNIRIIGLANSSTESVKFSFSGRSNRIENVGTFDVFAGSWYAQAGTYSVGATPYSKDNAQGTAGKTLTVSLKFV